MRRYPRTSHMTGNYTVQYYSFLIPQDSPLLDTFLRRNKNYVIPQIEKLCGCSIKVSPAVSRQTPTYVSYYLVEISYELPKGNHWACMQMLEKYSRNCDGNGVLKRMRCEHVKTVVCNNP